MHLRVRINNNGLRNHVNAVKIIRGLTGLGLRESKNFTDETIANPTIFFELDTHDNITPDNLSNIPSINMDIRQGFDYNIIEVRRDAEAENVNTDQEHVIIRCREFLLDNMIDLMNTDAPEVLQSAVIFFNTVTKHIKQHPVLFNV